MHGFALRYRSSDQLFLMLGRCTMVLYLLNTIFIGVAKAVYLSIHDAEFYFPAAVALIFLAGILGRWWLSSWLNGSPYSVGCDLTFAKRKLDCSAIHNHNRIAE